MAAIVVGPVKALIPYACHETGCLFNAADISTNGAEVLAKDYDHIYYWEKDGSESIGELLKKKPIELPYDKGPQDEAIAWKRDGSGFFVLGETVKEAGGNLVVHNRK